MGTIPIGSVIAFGGAQESQSGVPEGWLLCNGDAVSRTAYALLYAAIGDSSGFGDGSTTFNLPDYRSRFIRGVDNGANRDRYAQSRAASNNGGNSGAQVGSVQRYYTAPPSHPFTTDTAGDHTHAVPHLPIDRSYYNIAGSHYASWNPDSIDSSTDGAHSHTIVSGGDAESRPVNLYVNFLIYTGYFPS
jgi:microcystin-dependent protein